MSYIEPRLSQSLDLLSVSHSLGSMCLTDGRRAGVRTSPALAPYVFMQASNRAAFIRITRPTGSLHAAN